MDDENYVLSTIGSTLKSEGYKTIKTFSDPRKALIHILEMKENPNYYRLAIIDVRMPDINGINLYRMPKILNPSINIIFMSNLDITCELTTICPELKPIDILRKPLTVQKLIETVNNKISICLETAKLYDLSSILFIMTSGLSSILQDTLLCRLMVCS
ncbi:MAG TPA: response regulator [Verrucomicrobiae bacterium]|nr:response regulator [Verrucomicrobiae bacterium]